MPKPGPLFDNNLPGTLQTQINQSAAVAEPSGPSLLTALQEQLGLTVQSTTAPVDTIVIEHIEKPTEN